MFSIKQQLWHSLAVSLMKYYVSCCTEALKKLVAIVVLAKAEKSLCFDVEMSIKNFFVSDWNQIVLGIWWSVSQEAESVHM
jgi:hypothetical protein